MNASTSAAEIDPATYNAFVTDLELVGMELVKVHGERMAAGTPAQAMFNVTLGYTQSDDLIHYRYDLAAHLTDDQGVMLGSAEASVLLTARTTGAVDPKYVEHFGGTSGALMTHPYLREAIASTAQRIGFPGVLLPMIKHHPYQAPED
jgi:hypothetical protein